MSIASLPSWRCAPSGSLLWRSWGDDAVVFDVRSGEMHLLDPVARVVVRVLERAPGGPSDLTERVASALGVAPDVELERHLIRLLAELDEVGLTETVDSPGAYSEATG